MGSFWNQTKALFFKNLTYQKRHPKSIAWIILIPAMIFGFLFGVKIYLKTKQTKHSSMNPAIMPTEMPLLLPIPDNQYRAAKTVDMQYNDLPDASCRRTEDGSCPATFLFTGNNRTLAESLAAYMYMNSSTFDSTGDFINIADGFWGTDNGYLLVGDSLVPPDVFLYAVESGCSSNATNSLRTKIGVNNTTVEAMCLQGLHLWRDNYMEINTELFKGHYKGNPMGEINEIAAAYDLLDSTSTRFNAHVWYNDSITRNGRVETILSKVWNAYLQSLRGPSVKMVLEYVGEMGSPPSFPSSLSSILSNMASFFFTWIFLQLFPVVLTSVVYEKEQKMHIMMKMHGLGNGPYWVIMYMYFFIIGLIYMLLLILLGSLSGKSEFSMNSYPLQILFYGIHMNLLIVSAFLLSMLFSSTRTASVTAYVLLFGTWIIGLALFQGLIDDASFPRAYLIVLELFPGFSLYRGLSEFQAYGKNAVHMGTYGMRWNILSDSRSGIRELLIIMSAEWLVFVFIFALGNGFLRWLLSFSQKSRKSQPLPNPDSQEQDNRVLVQLDIQDIDQEKERVSGLLAVKHPGYPIISDNLMKIYPGKNGNPEKHAVRGLSLAIGRGECFGLLGPNGAGKTSFLNMMTGLTKPSSGTAYVGGMNLQKQMNEIYQSMGVCPQFNLLWDSLTGKEHLMFYGRLKNLKGHALTQAVEDSLRSVNLLQDAGKQSGKYSGGMKRRLSVAVSLIGDPKVVYMDEPGTGLDPASRDMLWDVVEKAKQDRAIILTTHSMEEAERLCDRIGIFVDGSLRCIGSPEELKQRYGGAYRFTITASPENEMDVENLAYRLSTNAKKVYNINGTQKFELPKDDVKLSDVFRAINHAKRSFEVRAWEITDTKLEDVFIKVATEAQ